VRQERRERRGIQYRLDGSDESREVFSKIGWKGEKGDRARIQRWAKCAMRT